MTYELKLPELGENIETAIVVFVLVSEGDTIEKDQSVVELETEKATTELPSPVAGKVDKILIKEGDEVSVGQVLMEIQTEQAQQDQSEKVDSKAEESRGEEKEKRKEPEPEPEPEVAEERESKGSPLSEKDASGVPEESLVRASPAVRRLARELGLNIAHVPHTGPADRLTIDDVKAHARALIEGKGEVSRGGATEQASASAVKPLLPDLSQWGEIETEPMSGVRRKTGEAMSRSWFVVPQVTNRDVVDVTELERFRKSHQKRVEQAGAKLTMTSILLRVVAEALKRFPKLNAAVDEAQHQIVYRTYVHIGVAVDAGHGLLVPVVRDVDKKSIAQLSVELGELSQKARTKKLAIDEMRGAGFTLSNLGGLGTTDFSPIVNWPEVAILGVNRSEMRPVWDGERFGPRLIMPLSLTYDHRLVDGADAARFLRFLAESLENPLTLFLGE